MVGRIDVTPADLPCDAARTLHRAGRRRAAAGLCALLMAAMPAAGADAADATRNSRPRALRLAVLGDSDSHAYQDRLHFPAGSPARGGQLRDKSLQWTELLMRLRAPYIDLGPWTEIGAHPRVARVRGWFGLDTRTPRKQDHLHNFAISGARCEDLNAGRWKESKHLHELIKEDRDAWQDAVVVIRIGINDIGERAQLDLLAANPYDTGVTRQIRACTQAVAEAVRLLRSEQPSLRFVLVGIFNNSHWAKYLQYWQNPVLQRNIDIGLDSFDNPLRALALDDNRIAFLDERRLFEADWGGRDKYGKPAYRTRRIGSSLEMCNCLGDTPENLALADGHMGTVWNGIWVNHLLDLLQQAFTVNIPQLSDSELLSVVGR